MKWCRLRGESGQALVEMALLLPALLLLVLGILEFGRAFHVKHVVTDAAREGARRAVVQDPLITADSVVAAVNRALNRASIPPASVTVYFDSFPPPTGHWRETGREQTVGVRVQHRLDFFGPLVKFATGRETVPLAAVLSMRNE